MMQEAGTLSPRIQQLVPRTRVISTQLFMYLQVREYGSCHFCTRHLEMHLSVTSASSLRRPSTRATKGVKCIRSFKRELRYFLFFLRWEVSRHFSRVLD